MRLQDKSAVITGAASGIGRAIALKFAHEGAAVMVADLDGKTVMGFADEIEADGGSAIGIGADITKRAEIDAMVAATIERFGRIDVLVNNAGSRIIKPFLEHTEEDWRRMLDVNLTGHFFCCQAVIPHMLEAGGGRIINMASIASFVGRPNRAGYVAAKGGLLSLTRALAADMAGKKITVNAVAPGMIASPLNRDIAEDQVLGDAWNAENLARRWGEPEDVAGVAAFLASDDAGFITGETITVDGGSIAALVRKGE
ncbi:MAG: SDR family NAD(P)-dependent oxidoreductase [Alphaproteobacteria bacterium]|jgi:NAD(P)-dependent dehydrogenase (short-subunit alcohol dehydrogenase family)|nr:SDR family NAD(P)-dependent oxidoreductase [Alphaproteobacteria bacterium]MCZ6847774.1 SDR family NAD(P)-dependent oxidoreductase [Alphaproteobacteria bacterium]